MLGMLYGDRKRQDLVCYMAEGRDKVWNVIWRQERTMFGRKVWDSTMRSGMSFCDSNSIRSGLLLFSDMNGRLEGMLSGELKRRVGETGYFI